MGIDTTYVEKRTYDEMRAKYEKERRHKMLIIFGFIIGLVCLAIGYFIGSHVGRVNKKVTKESVARIDSLQPYDRVFFSNSSPRCFHRDYNCEALRRTKVIVGETLLMVEGDSYLIPCKKCTEPYGIVHHITPEKYKAIFEDTEYVEEEETETSTEE